MWSQVSYIFRPMTPYTVMPLKMISLAKSTGTASLGMPSSWTRPPIRTAANAWCRAEGTPDISHTTSAPSPPVAWRTARTASSSAALMVRCAPIRAASSSRLAFTSDAMTFAAPAARATPTAKHPIGPHPAMNTVLPGMSEVRTVWNAFPMGSMIAPTVVGMPFRGSTLLAGIVMYCANAPSRSTPMMRVLRQMCPLPVRHWRQCPHTMCPSAVTSCPTFRSATSSTPSPTAAISPANSCPTTSGGLIRCCAQSSQSAMCRSVPHTPAWRTAIRTSPGPAVGLGTVVTFRPGAGLSLTTACTMARDASEDGPREAPVHLEHRAGNVAGPLGREERDGRGELVGAAHPGHRDALDHLSHHVLRRALLPLGAGVRQLGDALGRDESRTHHVHRDALRGDLVGEGLGDSQDARARRRGQDEPGDRLLGGDGCETDDPAPLELPHDRDGGARQVHCGEQVQLDRLLERRAGLMAERSRRRAARVAEENVETAELAVDAIYEALGLRRHADVGHERQHGLAGFRAELRRRALDCVVVPAVYRDAGALLREHLRHGATEPLSAAAHQGDTAGEAEIHRGGESRGTEAKGLRG